MRTTTEVKLKEGLDPARHQETVGKLKADFLKIGNVESASFASCGLGNSVTC